MSYFQRYQDVADEWRWRLRAANHETVAVSSEGYKSKTACNRSIEIVMDTNRNTPIHDVDG